MKRRHSGVKTLWRMLTGRRSSNSSRHVHEKEDDSNKDTPLAGQLSALLEDAIKANLEGLSKVFQQRRDSASEELGRLDADAEQDRTLTELERRCKGLTNDIGKLLDPSRKDGSYARDIQGNIFAPFVRAVLESPPLFFTAKDKNMKMPPTQRRRYAITFPEKPVHYSLPDLFPVKELKVNPAALPHEQQVVVDVTVMRDTLIRDMARTHGPSFKKGLLKKATKHWTPLMEQCLSRFKRYLQAQIHVAVARNFTGDTRQLHSTIG